MMPFPSLFLSKQGWLPIKLIQAVTGAEAVKIALVHHAITLIRLNLLATYRINEFASLVLITLFAMMMAVDHVRAAAISHHKIKKQGI
jgi:hypothetical protein